MNNLEATKRIIFEKLLKESGNPLDNGESINTPSGLESNLDKAYSYLNRLIESQTITSIRTVRTKRSGIIGKIVIFIKKVIRKLIYWYVEPICKSQTYYNEMNTQFSIQMFYNAQNMKTQNHDELLNRIQQSEKMCEETKQLIINLESQIEALIKEREKQQWLIEALSTDNKERYVQLVELTNQVSRLSENENKIVHMSDEIRKTVEDMQIIRRENEELFKPDMNDFWNKITVAQAGEDSIIAYILMVLGVNIVNEYYLDLGANHAKQLSNTYMLYKNGMRGVLVEANPQLIGELKFYRSEDVILNKCIAHETGEKRPFYILSGDGLSSMDINSVNEVIEKNPQIYIKEEVMVETITIDEILEKYFVKAPLVINIDIEGMEEDILQAVDFNRYLPFIIVVERIEYATTIVTEKRKDRIADIMTENGYFEYAFTGINSIFINRGRLEEIRNENSF